MQDLSLEGLFSLNNIRFHKAKTGLNFYGLVGMGGGTYDTKINALNGNAKYNFASIPKGLLLTGKKPGKTLKQ